MTNEPPESPALVMDGLAAGRRGGRGLGRGAPIKINVSFSWSRARHRGRNWRGVYERPGQRGAGRQKLGDRGGGAERCRDKGQRHGSPETTEWGRRRERKRQGEIGSRRERWRHGEIVQRKRDRGRKVEQETVRQVAGKTDTQDRHSHRGPLTQDPVFPYL